MDLQLQADFTEFESGFGFAIRMHFSLIWNEIQRESESNSIRLEGYLCTSYLLPAFDDA